ncbi:hypothetical protein [Methylomonas koyamae]|uniref:hypothetical protein n=1 Tax=Methylomonas koyamae TaxID=702114 RepID=UPI001C321A6A|nr:hypothetical protein [Methylomonas koyamae]BBL59265.1 hypothetical protein MKFW12EY_28780 [Methylomonas koyamae]
MSDEKRLSTTQLAKLRGVSQEQMFGQLTAAGRAAGGVYLTGKYGQYVAWPEARSLDAASAESRITKFQPSGEH